MERGPGRRGAVPSRRRPRVGRGTIGSCELSRLEVSWHCWCYHWRATPTQVPSESRRTGTRRSCPIRPVRPVGSRCATRCSCGERGRPSAACCLAAPTEDRDSRPAAWRSTDGVTWEALDVTAHDVLGPARDPVDASRCSNGQVVAVGARSGGAHGNPRVTTLLREARRTRRPARCLQPVRRRHGHQRRADHRRRPGLADHRQPGQRTGRVALHGRSRLHHRGGRARARRRGGVHLAGPGADLGRRRLGRRRRGQREVHPRPGARSSGSRPTRPLGASGGARQRGLRRPRARGRGRTTTWSRWACAATASGSGVARPATGAWGRSSAYSPRAPRASPFVSSLVTGDRGLWATTSDGATYALWHSTDGEEWAPVGDSRDGARDRRRAHPHRGRARRDGAAAGRRRRGWLALVVDGIAGEEGC